MGEAWAAWRPKAGVSMATKCNSWGKTAQHRRPDGSVRQSQLITTFGPGALVDLVSDAVVISGLEFWHFPEKFRSIDEPRLRDDLVDRFRKLGRKLDPQRPFREPPIGDLREPHPGCGIDALEFPRWFVCQNDKCRALVKSDHLERKNDKYWHSCDTGNPTECVPVRFVAACKNGHLDEFPWVRWTHEPTPICAAPRLKLLDGATGDFSEVRVHCVCGAHRPLISALVDASNPPCFGRRPWLGSEGDEECSEHVRLLTRTGSNAYYAQVESALSIPEGGHRLRELVQNNWDVLEAVVDENDLAQVRKFAKKLAVLNDWPPKETVQTIGDVRAGTPAVREALRVSEYRQLTAAKPEVPGEIPERGDTFHARRIATPAVRGLRSVVLVKKLRQVRVQVGFTRIESATANLQGEFDLAVRSAPLSLTREWLPAAEVLGEGIFIELDEAAVHAWEMRASTMARTAELAVGYARWREQKDIDMAFPGARFYLLHSLSHLLMSALSLECGYPASSLTERIFCAPPDSDFPMSGLLLMTGSPSADGTLGGLVEQGRRLEEHFSRAFQMGGLCSNDPVCAQHTPQHDLAERYLEGAACHGCLYVAESSCERFNNFLDRALVVPTLGANDCAFFDGKATNK
jgi:hypothetical protein